MAKLDFSKGTMVRVSCPKCGKVQRECAANEYRYGVPIKTCQNRKCGERYLDPFFHELAAEPPAPAAFSVKQKLIGMAVFAAVFAVSFAFHWFEITYEGSYHVAFPALMVGTAIGEIALVIEIVLIKTGFKERRTERLRRESVERFGNPAYVRELKMLGYPVPEEYLSGEDRSDGKQNIPDFLF